MGIVPLEAGAPIPRGNSVRKEIVSHNLGNGSEIGAVQRKLEASHGKLQPKKTGETRTNAEMNDRNLFALFNLRITCLNPYIYGESTCVSL